MKSSKEIHYLPSPLTRIKPITISRAWIVYKGSSNWLGQTRGKSSLNQRVWEITVFVRPLRGAKLDLNKRNQYTTTTAIAKPKSLPNTTSESLPILILSIQSWLSHNSCRRSGYFVEWTTIMDLYIMDPSISLYGPFVLRLLALCSKSNCLTFKSMITKFSQKQ